MRHPKAEKWEAKLDAALHDLDRYFEIKYKDEYRLHPSRPAKGETANPSHDGLFGISASFSMGLGSELGKGYIVKIRIVTLEKVDADFQNELENEAMHRLREILPKYFPYTKLEISKDKDVIKIYGDLSLGDA